MSDETQNERIAKSSALIVRRASDKLISGKRIRYKAGGNSTNARYDYPDNGQSGDSAAQDNAAEAEKRYAARYRRRERGRRILALMRMLFMCFLLYLGVMGGVYLSGLLPKNNDNWPDDLMPVSSVGGRETIFTLENGWTLTRTATALYEQGLIRSAESFTRLGKQENLAESIKAGKYLLSTSMSCDEILEALVKGSVLTIKFTIPEGYTLRQIAKTLADKGIATESQFWESARNGDFNFPFLKGLPNDERRLEGYLFPDTYEVELDEAIDKVLTRMLKRFEEIWASLPPSATGLSARETLILASIVQNEVKLDEERPVAAGVFIKRLKNNMLLQSCSTVQYYFDEPKYPLLTSDTEIDFPYNTYIYNGLPPGPVGAPGKVSLEAAVDPEDTNYLYFVARDDGSGGHYFSRTLEEHNQAVAKARANRSKGQ